MSTASAAAERTATRDARRPRSVGRAVVWSLCAHLAAIAAAVLTTVGSTPQTLPPAYSVELVAAPPGARSLGAVEKGTSAEPARTEPAVSPTPRPADASVSTPARRKVPAAKTPAQKRTDAPAKPAVAKRGGDREFEGKAPAGGGPTGGRGRDVANVKVQGIAFPFPGYLENVTRQIALNFRPRPGGGALRAEIAFLIHRDGSVSDLRLVSRSGVYAFDLECMGAVEAVGQRRSFGALPSGFRDDVLPVVFSFDPTVLR